MNNSELAKLIDHTILKPHCQKVDIENICKEAIEHQFAAVCIPPYFVDIARQLLVDHPQKIATVVGFPMGYSTTSAKVEEVKRAIGDGADEIDVVINICAVKEEKWSYVKNDINSMTTAAQMKGKIIKIILETALLSDEEIKMLCKICNEEEVNYVKTSTGFNGGGATVEAVSLMRKELDSSIKIKASGGIRTKEDAKRFVKAGADRLGCSASVAIVS